MKKSKEKKKSDINISEVEIKAINYTYYSKIKNYSPELARKLAIFEIQSSKKCLLKPKYETIILEEDVPEIINFFKSYIDKLFQYKMKEYEKELDEAIKIPKTSLLSEFPKEFAKINKMKERKPIYERQCKELVVMKRELTMFKKQMQYEIYRYCNGCMKEIEIADICKEYIDNKCNEYHEQIENIRKILKERLNEIYEELK